MQVLYVGVAGRGMFLVFPLSLPDLVLSCSSKFILVIIFFTACPAIIKFKVEFSLFLVKAKKMCMLSCLHFCY